MVFGCQPNAQHPNWRTRVSLFVWNFTLALSSFRDPASSYATPGITLEIMGSPKYYKLEIPVGRNICPSETNSCGFNGLQLHLIEDLVVTHITEKTNWMVYVQMFGCRTD
jgi:hypothetical protein